MQTRKLALLSTMLAGLGLAGLGLAGLGSAALAQDATTDPAQQPLPPTDQTEGVQQTPDASGTPGADALGEAPPEGGIVPEGEAPGTGLADEGADAPATEPGLAADPSTPTPSVGTAGDAFGGTLPDGMPADTLIGLNVVDAAGESVGSVSDLLIGADNAVDRAIIDVGGFLGFGAKSVALEIDRLTVAEGDGEVVVDVTRDELEAMPEWQRDDSGWFTTSE